MKRQGIVLSHVLTTHRCIILDATEGRLNLVIKQEQRQQRLMQGALITYTYESRRQHLRLQEAQIIQLPLPSLCVDLSFLHRVMMIVLQSLPSGIESSELFALLATLYDEAFEAQLTSEHVRTFFLCKLLSILGIYPEEKVFCQTPQLHQLLLLPLHAYTGAVQATVTPHLFDTWLASCSALEEKAHHTAL
jgi:recombinational DNA repair protein (RecF pathway)